MARYIDTDLLIKNIVKIEDLRTLSTKTIGEAISNTPTADVVEVRHGEWILHPDGSATCNQCKTHQLLIWDMDRSQNFCGHCGAKMDGGEVE